MMTSVLGRNVMGKLCLFVFFLFLFPSCIATWQDISSLNSQIADLNTRLNDLQEVTGTKFSSDLDSIRANQAEIGAEIDKVRGEIQDLSGRVEDNRQLVRRAIERDTTEQDVMKATLPDLTLRVAELEASAKQVHEYLGLEPIGAMGEQGPERRSPDAEAPPKQTSGSEEEAVSPEEEFYASTLSIYKEGRYEEVIADFKRFIKKYPKSVLADNAQFWMGECYMSLKQYEQAILAYQKVIKNYPKGNKVPNAMLRQALAFYEIKDKTSSRLLMKKIIKKYPDSSEAAIAKTRLKTMK